MGKVEALYTGGGLARVATFHDRRNQQLGSAAYSTPVVLIARILAMRLSDE
jgi:hypothetical protein